MENIYMLSDTMILSKIGASLKNARLKQNITQQRLADETKVSLSSIKKMEAGEMRSVDTLLRVLRVLGKLDVLQPLVEEEQLTPSEYYELVNSVGAHSRKRATGKKIHKEKEEPEW